jgi:transposase-like protein
LSALSVDSSENLRNLDFTVRRIDNEFNYRWGGAVQIRTCPYLNNVVEQDHRRIKARVGPMLGFKCFFNARRVLAGVQLVQQVIKGQFQVPEKFGIAPVEIWHNVLAA